MLVLVIPQIKTLVFVFNLRLRIVPDVPRIICKQIVSEGPKKSKTFWASVLEEAGAARTLVAACHLVKFYSSHLKMFVKIKVGIIVAVDKLTVYTTSVLVFTFYSKVTFAYS